MSAFDPKETLDLSPTRKYFPCTGNCLANYASAPTGRRSCHFGLPASFLVLEFALCASRNPRHRAASHKGGRRQITPIPPRQEGSREYPEIQQRYHCASGGRSV